MPRVSSFDTTLDTCVLLPITLCDTLLRFGEAGFYRPHWSAETLDELERNLVRRMGLTPAQARRRMQQMKDYFPEALVSGYERLIRSMPNDPKDRHVAAAAVKSRSQVIVTANLKDFPTDVLAELDIEPQHPDRFLLYQCDLDPTAAGQIIIQQAQDKSRPPQTVANVLDRLQASVPTFADAMRALLGLPTIRPLSLPPALTTLTREVQSVSEAS